MDTNEKLTMAYLSSKIERPQTRPSPEPARKLAKHRSYMVNAPPPPLIPGWGVEVCGATPITVFGMQCHTDYLCGRAGTGTDGANEACVARARLAGRKWVAGPKVMGQTGSAERDGPTGGRTPWGGGERGAGEWQREGTLRVAEGGGPCE